MKKKKINHYISNLFLSLFIKIKDWLKEPSTNRKITVTLIVLSFVFSIFTYLVFSNSIPYVKSTPFIATTTLIIDAILILALCFKVIRRIVKIWHDRRKGYIGSKISTKFILIFGSLVLIPTLVVAIFSSLFFNLGMKTWFNDKVLTIAEQSNTIANSYLKEHRQNLRSDALSMAKEIDSSFDVIFLDLIKLNKFVDSQVKSRELTEGFIFKKNGEVLARAGFTISSVPDLITGFEILQAESGEVIFTSKRKDRVRALVRLNNIKNTYLSIGRFIDPQIINQIEIVKQESEIYQKLFEQRSRIEINFYIVFILISLLILLISILVALLFADNLINPITNLIKTSNEIKSGNLSAKVPQTSSNDEISLLIKTFNEMTKKLKIQRIELQKRERNAAWSDIARRIAHEIKNPLTPIQLSAEYLKSKTKSKESKNYANTIVKQVNSMKKMVDEFSMFAKLPSPKFNTCNLNKICYDLLLLQKKVNPNIKISLKSIKNNLYLKADESQISMAINNIIKNSIESISEKNKNNGKLRGNIHLSIIDKRKKIILKVEDNGIGLPNSYIKNKVLEPYITTKKNGTGLGLAIVVKIIKDHNGIFNISNNKNKIGATSLIELPKGI